MKVSEIKEWKSLGYSALEWLNCADKWAETMLKKARDKGEIVACDTCSDGHCCKQPVIATFLDAFPIAYLHHKAEMNISSMRSSLMIIGEGMEDSMLTGESFDRTISCPFFSVDSKRCSVYKMRPVICRSFYALRTSENCRRNKKREKVCAIDYSPLVSRLIQDCMNISKLFGKENKTVYIRSLPAAVSIIMKGLSDPANFWDIVLTECTLPPSKIMEMVLIQARIDGDKELENEIEELIFEHG